MSAITAKASRIMKKYAVLTREPRCFLGSFDFSWEQRKAKEICSIGTGKSNTQDQVDDGKYPFYIRSDVPVRSNKYLYDCEAVITIGDGNIGKVFHYVNGKFDLHQRCYKMTDFKDIWGKYFFYYFSTKFYDRAMKMTAKATVDSVRLEMISEMDIKKPPQISEQKQIAEFFANLDNLITLHQRKCANLCSPSQVVFSLLFATSTFSWEQRKFEEIAVRSSVICSDDTLPRVEYEDIVSGTGRLNKDIYAKQSIKSGIAFHQGDVLYGKLRPYLQNWLLPTFDGLAVGDFWVLQPQNADSSFLYRLIQSRQFDEVANQSTGTKMPRADWKLVSKTVFSIPSNISEQAAIGTYFTALDSLITLHQRECISFTGRADRLILTANKKRTTSSWEQRKLGDVGETYTGLSGKTKADFGHGQARFITYMNVFSNPISNPEMTEPIEIDPKQNEVEVGDVFFTTSSETPEEVGMSSVLLEKRGKIYLNSFCFGFRPTEKIDSYYLAYMLRSESAREKIILLAQGISRYNISKNKVMEIAVSLPSLDEQKLIGQYFRQLDNLITLHQRKPFLMKWRTSDANRNQTNRLVL